MSLHIKDYEVREYESVLNFYQEVLHDSLGIPYGRVYQLYTHSGRGKCRIAELFKCYLGLDVDTCWDVHLGNSYVTILFGRIS
jgi:hypothetical protein